ncbi:helix-turn-helix domain-containing protein [Verrucomicrobiota bacterium sgz303538]
MPPARAENSSSRPSFVSTQVSEARRYFLNLTPKRGRLITVVCGGCERVRPDYVVRRQTFPFLAIEFVAEGEGELELAGRKYSLRPGMAFAYGPDAAHVIHSDPARPMLKYYVDFSGTEGERLLAASPLGGWRAVQLSSLEEVVELFELLQREGASESTFGAQICAALIPALLLKITERALPGGIAEPRALATYRRAKKWIEDNCLQARTAEEVAAACHLDTAYLCRLFKRFGHTTPYRFLTRQKMNRAADLLLDRGMLVKEAAAELGFSDAFQFSRAFKRVYGLPPERFIRHGRAGSSKAEV